jgi:hypothetical protein
MIKESWKYSGIGAYDDFSPRATVQALQGQRERK